MQKRFEWWIEKDIIELKEKYFYYIEHKEEAEVYFQRTWQSIRRKASNLGITSIKINKECASFLGEHVAERVLSHVFIDVQRMKLHNSGYDFICNKGFKIDVKSSCLNKNNSYIFSRTNNEIADYFLCIGFDNRDNLNPKHIWLIKSDEIIRNRRLNILYNLNISNNTKTLILFSKYELTDKLKDVISCCDILKNKNED